MSTPPTNEVALRPSMAVGLPIDSLAEAQELARILAMASIMPRDLRGKPADVLAVLLYGRELGLTAWQSITGINIIEGRATMSAELRIAKTRERGHRVSIACRTCAHFAEHPAHDPAPGGGRHRFVSDHDATRCTVRAVRGDTGETAVVTFTVQDAAAAGLLKILPNGTVQARSTTGKPLPWEHWTADMLYHRASDRAARQIAPEVGYGLYDIDTTERIMSVDAEPVTCSHCGRTGHAVEMCPDIVDAEPVDDDAVAAEVARAAREYEGDDGAQH